MIHGLTAAILENESPKNGSLVLPLNYLKQVCEYLRPISSAMALAL